MPHQIVYSSRSLLRSEGHLENASLQACVSRLAPAQPMPRTAAVARPSRHRRSAVVTCASDYAYGEQGSGAKIPGGATLKFDVELVSFDAGAGGSDEL